MIEVKLNRDNAKRIIEYLAQQDINDTEHIVDKYELKNSLDSYEDALQELHDNLYITLKDE